MAASVFDSAMFSKLFPSGDVGRLFTDTAEVRAMLLVEGTLAKIQGAAGVIPNDSATFIHRATMELQIDPAGLANETGQNGVSVPALVAAFRKVMEAPEHSQYVHWGATSQDIIDTSLMLRLRQALGLIETELRALLALLAKQAESHATTAMAARTYGQQATPTTYGAVVASWGAPLLDLLTDLPDLKAKSLVVSLSGAAGTASQLGDDPAALRSAMASALGLRDPLRSWHVDRRPVLMIADWLAHVTHVLAKIGADVAVMTQSEIAELHLGSAGASSTMPQKENPVAASVLTALSRQTAGLHSVMQGALTAQNQRDGGAWFSEWLCLPQIVLAAASAAQTARKMVTDMRPDPARMTANLAMGDGLIHAEALTFALADQMPRPDAAAKVKDLCAEARDMRQMLPDLVARDFPDLDLEQVFDPDRQLGQAPAAARHFSNMAKI
jgi:3-carboxy-cis,cis-muconate cycloisomerase